LVTIANELVKPLDVGQYFSVQTTKYLHFQVYMFNFLNLVFLTLLALGLPSFAPAIAFLQNAGQSSIVSQVSDWHEVSCVFVVPIVTDQATCFILVRTG
jgi:hypothetical protein